MKKALYVILFALVASLSFTSCTEEVVKPTGEAPAGGAIDPIRR